MPQAQLSEMAALDRSHAEAMEQREVRDPSHPLRTRLSLNAFCPSFIRLLSALLFQILQRLAMSLMPSPPGVQESLLASQRQIKSLKSQHAVTHEAVTNMEVRVVGSG